RTAQGEDALAMRPDGEVAVLEERQPAGWRDRGMGEIAARIGRLEALLALSIRTLGRAEFDVDHWPLQEPRGLLLRRGRLPATTEIYTLSLHAPPPARRDA